MATRPICSLCKTSRIAVALNLELVGVEATRPTEHPDALDYILRGRAAHYKPPSREVRAEAIRMFERALALDPRSVEAQSWLSMNLTTRVRADMTDSPDADMERAEDLARQALATSPRSPLPHMAKGGVLRAHGRYDEALAEYETVIALNRNWVAAYHHIGQCKLFTGSIEETIPFMEQAIRLSPHDYNICDFYHRIGLVHLLQSRTDEAIIWFEKARSANPAPAVIHAQLASAYALKGETERAATELAEARKLSRDDRYSSISCLKASQYFGVPKIRALFEASYFAGLRLAGMPEK